MTLDEVQVQYDARLQELQAGSRHARFRQMLAAVILAIALALIAVFGLLAVQHEVSWAWPLAPIPVAAVAARLCRHYRRTGYRLWRLACFYQRAIERTHSDWAHSGISGEEFLPPDHVYARDLNVCGEGSLFELLCIAKTSIGQQGVASYLLEPPAADETLLRQEAVRELKSRVDLRERVATLGEREFVEAKMGTFEDWLNSAKFHFPQPVRVLIGVTSTLVAALLLTCLLGSAFWNAIRPWLVPLAVLHSVIGLIFREAVNRMHILLRPVSVETYAVREGLHMLEGLEFKSAKLRSLVAQVQHAGTSVRELDRLLFLLNERQNPWYLMLPNLLLAGTQLCMAIEAWRDRHGEDLKTWLHAWAEFEALNALAAYAYENPDNAFPEFSLDSASASACFEAEALGHPLLPHNSCVLNDVELNQEAPFYVLSGSNMSGKSTLLRAIGLNAVLALAGAPVRAKSLRLSAGLAVFASISVVDSLLNGKSKFQAEVDRLRQTIESALNDRPVLFIVDEIFSGTNSRDRRVAAEAVVRTLVGCGAIGVLSTHDLALTEIASADGLCGRNVHMGSKGGIDPMDFDYRLKPGITEESNALAIARMSGVPV